MTPKAKKNCSAKETSFELILMRRRVVLPASLEISRAASNLTVNQGTKPGFKRCNKIPNTRYKKRLLTQWLQYVFHILECSLLISTMCIR